MKRLTLLFAALSLCAFSVTADTYSRQPGVDALHYVFRLTLSDDTDEIVGEATVDLRFIKDGQTEFTLDLTSVADGKGMTVSEVTSGGALLRYVHQSDLLRIT